MNETNYEALRSAFETIVAHIKALDTRLIYTAGNVETALTEMEERLQKLEDRFDHLTTASDDGIVSIVRNDEQIREFIETIADQRIESSLEAYDPGDAIDDGDLADKVLNSYTFQDGVKDAVKELTFTVEVH